MSCGVGSRQHAVHPCRRAGCFVSLSTIKPESWRRRWSHAPCGGARVARGAGGRVRTDDLPLTSWPRVVPGLSSAVQVASNLSGSRRGSCVAVQPRPRSLLPNCFHAHRALEPSVRFELTTSALQERRSTTELTRRDGSILLHQARSPPIGLSRLGETRVSATGQTCLLPWEGSSRTAS
jgi:hypothetical protein